ncbi:sporulation transcriptional regulator SpoIIID [Anaerobranca gottschalkii]|uniref:Putative DeoR family transcriptional regulator, stage III sporulation protein D n=1 Tax=Anaerobranca gottschalkii DSM 13577 TaxID=1120990 RepID=A0A1I0CGQ8_9FIRM|nr:sporulation transcriptional regulator SpoIIID [Anaerobranca gottschalkii]SET18604.1 putative DeoR family transcriptional regulator, stage III sporulation protein D [Anaerobranca gottschalkii DSM 13577]
MNDYIIQRVLEISHYILKTEETVREISKKFGVSKSTVHKDLVERLPLINKELYGQVKEILEKNKSVRHIRGGESTRLKYMNKELVSE